MTMRHSGPAPRSGIEAIAAYSAGKAKGAASGPVVKLSSNEGAFEPSPGAVAAAQDVLRGVVRYPDGGANRLRQAIAERYDLNPDQVICGNGSGELLSLLSQCFISPGDEVVFTAHTFALYEIAARANGAQIRVAPDPGLRVGVEDILAKVSTRTRIVFLANPNNPTGTYLTRDEVRRLHEGLSDRVLLVLDGAYAEFVTAEDFDPGVELVDEAPNVVMTRTFSKIHALAGLRLGWAFAPKPVIDVLNKVRGPFNVNAAAQAAGIAALEDRDHVARCLAHNSEWRPWLESELTALGLEVVPSVANFVLARFASAEAADLCHQALVQQNILVRPTASFGLPDALRITVGPAEDLHTFVDAMRVIMPEIHQRGR